MRPARPYLSAVFLIFAAVHSRAAESLADRVRNFLTGGRVVKARRTTAVAAVRGSAPQDQQQDLDQLLLETIAAHRSAETVDRRALKALYEALSLSYAAQAFAASSDAELRAAAAAELAAWSRAPRKPAPPAALVQTLRRPADAFDEKALVAAGWGRYVRSLLAPAPPGVAPAARAFDAETSRLDEMLAGLRDSWLSRELDAPAKGKALLLAAQVSAALGSAPLRVERAAQAAALEVSAALPAAPEEPAVEFAPRRIYDAAARSVVVIIASDPGGAGEVGTGSVIAPGRVLTNAHVVIRDSTKAPWPGLKAYFKPARMTGDPKSDLSRGATARVLAHDRALDLALLEIEGAPADAPPIPLADPPTVSIGDRVAAIGHPEQGGLWTLTTGVLSSLVADIGGVKGKHVFQTDASINRGNSGGPLLDARGRIVGVNTLMSRKAADGLAITAVNFSVRSDVASAWLRKTGTAPAAKAPLVAAAPAPRASKKPTGGGASARASSGPLSASAAKKELITESKPFSPEELIEREIREMEDLEAEMKEEVRKRR